MYQKAIITFLDVLGFRDIVATSEAQTVDKVLAELGRFAAPKPDTRRADVDEYEPQIITFSDCVIRVRPIQTKANRTFPIGLVFYEILDLLHAQGELINKRILIRGAVTYGDIYIMRNKIFGPALIEAYELESNQAIYPRVIISNKLLAELKANPLLRSNNNHPKEEIKYVRQMLTRGQDKQWFVDYLRAIERELDEPSMYPTFLSNHKQLIETARTKYAGRRSIRAKYSWLARYHNDLVSRFPDKWFSYYHLKRKDVRVILRKRNA